MALLLPAHTSTFYRVRPHPGGPIGSTSREQDGRDEEGEERALPAARESRELPHSHSPSTQDSLVATLGCKEGQAMSFLFWPMCSFPMAAVSSTTNIMV